MAKLANLMKMNAKLRQDVAEFSITFAYTINDMRKKFDANHELLLERNKEIEELKLQIEGMTNE